MSELQLQRPGGLGITERGASLCGFEVGAVLADIGCGAGATVRYLTEKGFDVTGVDIVQPETDFKFIRAAAERLPFDASSLDGLLFECSLSKTAQPDAVFSECARVLKPGGKLMVSDLYARGEPAVLSGRLGRLERRESILSRAQVFGFDALHFEDCSDALLDMWAKLVFAEGAEALHSELGADGGGLKRIKCGYFLAVFERRGDRLSRVDRLTVAQTGCATTKSLRAWQLGKIRETISRAAGSAFYGRLLDGINEAEITDFAAFERLPFTDQGDLAGGSLRLLTVSPDAVRRIVTQRTSGTTGASKRLYFTRGDLFRTEEFFTFALSDYVRSGNRAAVFMSNDTGDGIGDLLRRSLKRIGVETEICGVIEDFAAAADAARGCSLLVGLPAQMLRLCRTASGLTPDTVLLSADYIAGSVESALKKAWNCNIIRHFGMTETCFGCAVDCADGGGQHIRHADFYIEIIDPESGGTLPHGTEGEIVLTTLRSEAMPLIRYRTGDLGTLEDAPCACGGVFPRLGRVSGRRANKSARVDIHTLDELVLANESVLGFAARFDGALHLTVDGGEIDCAELAKTLGVEVNVIYGHVAESRGKRRLGDA